MNTYGMFARANIYNGISNSTLPWAQALLNNCQQKLVINGQELDWVSVISGPGCSKLTTLLVNVSLKFQTLISEIDHYFLLKKCQKLLQIRLYILFLP